MQIFFFVLKYAIEKYDGSPNTNFVPEHPLVIFKTSNSLIT